MSDLLASAKMEKKKHLSPAISVETRDAGKKQKKHKFIWALFGDTDVPANTYETTCSRMSSLSPSGETFAP